MDRKAQYKHKVPDIQNIRDRNRSEENALRKDKKDKALSAKRFRFITEEEAGQEISVEEVRTATASLKKSGPHRTSSLHILKQAFSQGSLYIDKFFSVEGALSCLVSIYTGQDTELQIEAAWCITNISGGTHEHAMAIAKYVAPYLVTYLSSNVAVLQDQSAWSLGNLAGDGHECRSMIHAQGVIQPLINLLQSSHPAVVQSALFALSNLVKESLEISREVVEAGIIPHIPKYLQYTPENENILTEASWVLTYLAASEEFCKEIVESNLLLQVVNLLVQLSKESPHKPKIVTPLLRCLGNICSGPDSYTIQACSNSGILLALSSFLSSEFRHVKKECLWVLSNMAGEVNTCQAIATSPLLTQILQQLPAAFDIKMETLYVLCNIAYHGEEMCSILVKNGLLQQVIPVLKLHDLEILDLGLSLCEINLRMTKESKNLFEENGGMNYLEGLEYHSNTNIRQKASDLLENYFYNEQDEHG